MSGLIKEARILWDEDLKQMGRSEAHIQNLTWSIPQHSLYAKCGVWQEVHSEFRQSADHQVKVLFRSAFSQADYPDLHDVNDFMSDPKLLAQNLWWGQSGCSPGGVCPHWCGYVRNWITKFSKACLKYLLEIRLDVTLREIKVLICTWPELEMRNCKIL